MLECHDLPCTMEERKKKIANLSHITANVITKGLSEYCLCIIPSRIWHIADTWSMWYFFVLTHLKASVSFTYFTPLLHHLLPCDLSWANVSGCTFLMNFNGLLQALVTSEDCFGNHEIIFVKVLHKL